MAPLYDITGHPLLSEASLKVQAIPQKWLEFEELGEMLLGFDKSPVSEAQIPAVKRLLALQMNYQVELIGPGADPMVFIAQVQTRGGRSVTYRGASLAMPGLRSQVNSELNLSGWRKISSLRHGGTGATDEYGSGTKFP